MNLTYLNSFPTSSNFCRLLITFANSLDPDQARQNVGPDLDPNYLTLWWYSWKICFWKKFKKNILRRQKKHAKLPSMQRVKGGNTVLNWSYAFYRTYSLVRLHSAVGSESACRSRGCKLLGYIIFVEIGHEIISMIILSHWFKKGSNCCCQLLANYVHKYWHKYWLTA